MLRIRAGREIVYEVLKIGIILKKKKRSNLAILSLREKWTLVTWNILSFSISKRAKNFF